MRLTTCTNISWPGRRVVTRSTDWATPQDTRYLITLTVAMSNLWILETRSLASNITHYSHEYRDTVQSLASSITHDSLLT